MNRLGSGSLIVVGIFLVLFGLLLQSWLVEKILDILGIITIIAGAGVGIVGLIKMFSGGRASSSDV